MDLSAGAGRPLPASPCDHVVTSAMQARFAWVQLVDYLQITHIIYDTQPRRTRARNSFYYSRTQAAICQSKCCFIAALRTNKQKILIVAKQLAVLAAGSSLEFEERKKKRYAFLSVWPK